MGADEHAAYLDLLLRFLGSEYGPPQPGGENIAKIERSQPFVACGKRKISSGIKSPLYARALKRATNRSSLHPEFCLLRIIQSFSFTCADTAAITGQLFAEESFGG